MISAVRAACVFFLTIGILVCSTFIARAQIAPGVQHSAAQTANVTGNVLDASGRPVAGANVYMTGQGAVLRTKTDANGAFTFASVPFGTYLISANARGLGQVDKPNVVINGDATLSISFTTTTAKGLKTIAEVTTRSAGAHINVTAASIASVAPTEYAMQGNVSWQQMLNRIPGVAVGGGAFGGGSTNVAIPDSPFVPIILSINGALPYETWYV